MRSLTEVLFGKLPKFEPYAADRMTWKCGPAALDHGYKDGGYVHPEPVPESTLNWMRYFYGFAEHAATKSRDTTKVGAALIGPEGEVRLTGFNGPSRGVLDLPERFERPAKYDWINHAEASVIGFAAREGIRTKGCTLYVTHAPCSNCASLIVQAGVTKVVYGPGTTSMPTEKFEIGQQMFREAGIVCEALK